MTPGSSNTLNPALIVFVEDDPGDQELIRNIMNSARWDGAFRLLASAEELFDLLDSITDPLRLPTLIVLDFNLPRPGGEATLMLLKKDRRFQKIPVVLYFTAMTQEKEHELLSVGANYCRRKPSNLNDLHQLFGEFIGFAQLLQRGKMAR